MAASTQTDEVTYESLVNRWKKELKSATVSKLDAGFYQAVDLHLRTLQDEYSREHALNPSSPKVMMLQDELRNLTRARDDIYDLRERKIAIAALVNARGGNPDRSAFTKGENEIYEELVRVLKEGRRNLLKRGEREMAAAVPGPPEDARSGGPPAPLDAVAFHPTAVATPAAQAAVAPEAPPEAPLPGMAPPAAPSPPAAADPATRVSVEAQASAGAVVPAPKSGRVLVKVLQNVDPFTASDLRTYRLAAEDVVALPPEFAQALVARGLAAAVT